MSMTKIRKNAFTKIQAILGTSVGVISRSSVSRIDDGHDDEYALSSAEEAIMWLKCHQDRAQVYIGVSLENGNFCTLSALFNQSRFVTD